MSCIHNTEVMVNGFMYLGACINSHNRRITVPFNYIDTITVDGRNPAPVNKKPGGSRITQSFMII